jgi:hypothetical protein
MAVIHGGKDQNDKIGAQGIVALPRGGRIPLARVYPAEAQSARERIRRRKHPMRQRAELLRHVPHFNQQRNLPDIG